VPQISGRIPYFALLESQVVVHRKLRPYSRKAGIALIAISITSKTISKIIIAAKIRHRRRKATSNHRWLVVGGRHT